MIISIKDSLKLFGISVMAACAVTVCSLFLHYALDIQTIAGLICDPLAQALYDAQVMTAEVICGVTGGCLALTSAVMLVFYVRHYLDSHTRELGLLKALGYGELRISAEFSLFGASVLVGCGAGYLISRLLMPTFYRELAYEFLPEFSPHPRGWLFVLLVLVPALVYALLAVCSSLRHLRRPCAALLRGEARQTVKPVAVRDRDSFLAEMRSAVLKRSKTMVFLVGFSAFCFSDILGMIPSMNELAGEMFGLMLLVIGSLLALTTLYIGVTSVIRANRPYVTMMRIFGYDSGECRRAVLDGYRPAALIGFAAGAVYQYLLLKVMLEVVFAGVDGVPVYRFDFQACLITLGLFLVLYEGSMFICGHDMKRISLSQIMGE